MKTETDIELPTPDAPQITGENFFHPNNLSYPGMSDKIWDEGIESIPWVTVPGTFVHIPADSPTGRYLQKVEEVKPWTYEQSS